MSGSRAARASGWGPPVTQGRSRVPARGVAAVADGHRGDLVGEDVQGYQAAAGIGFDVDNWNLAASIMRRDTSKLGDVTSVMVTLLGMGR